ncbi:MAG: SDR family oxidoreductase [Desulfobacterium sp.]|nr:SDR family oxidoreductase [Desulfobacterium sp.]MBU3949199.1 SDR family oxidoreductase [Pseudomonadota bacterium]
MRLAEAGAKEMIKAGRWGTPDDIAKAVCFLSSGMADYITGSLISVDGGFLLM